MISKKLVILTTIFLIPLFLFGYSGPEKDKEIIETIYNNSPAIDNIADLDKQLNNVFENNDSSKTIIKQVFSANLIASAHQKLNESSTNLFKKAILSCEKLNRKDLRIWVSVQYAYYLYTYRKYEASFPLFMYCIKNLDQTDDNEVIAASETYKKIAYFLTTVGDHAKAIEYLQIAKRNVKLNISELASITDALGICYIRLNKPKEAEKYFNETLIHAKASKDELRYGKALGNLAEIDFKNKNFTLALTRLKEDLILSNRVGNVQNTIYALVLLSKVFLASGNLQESIHNLNLARDLASTNEQYTSNNFEINSLILEIAKKTGNEKDEFLAMRNLEKLKNELKALDSKEIIIKMGWELEKNKLQTKVTKERDHGKNESNIKVIAIICCVLLIIIMMMVVEQYKTKSKKTKDSFNNSIQLFELDKANSEQKLNAGTKTLESYKTYLIEKNEQIQLLENEIEEVKSGSSYNGNKNSEQILSLLNSHLLTNESWLDFKKSFIGAYPDYYQYLSQNFSGMTDSNLRLIFLTKLGMNTTEISRILGLSVDAVKKAKQRLKKRYADSYDTIFEEQKKPDDVTDVL